jgi:hypothetical protein
MKNSIYSLYKINKKSLLLLIIIAPVAQWLKRSSEDRKKVVRFHSGANKNKI